jgi:hypothetical protein
MQLILLPESVTSCYLLIWVLIRVPQLADIVRLVWPGMIYVLSLRISCIFYFTVFDVSSFIRTCLMALFIGTLGLNVFFQVIVFSGLPFLPQSHRRCSVCFRELHTEHCLCNIPSAVKTLLVCIPLAKWERIFGVKYRHAISFTDELKHFRNILHIRYVYRTKWFSLGFGRLLSMVILRIKSRNGKVIKLYSIFTVHFSSIDNVSHQLNALVIKTLKYSKTVW